MRPTSTAARTGTALPRPAAPDVNPRTNRLTTQLTSVQKSSEPAHAAAAAPGERAQLQHTAYSPQQPASSEHISQLAASAQPRSQKQWHRRHMSRTPARPPLSPSGASACPLAHCCEKSTFFGHMRPHSSTHSELKLCDGIKRRLAARNEPRHAGFAPSAATSTVHRPVSSFKAPQTTPVRPFMCGVACKPAMRTRDPLCTVAAAAADDCAALFEGEAADASRDSGADARDKSAPSSAAS